MGKSKKQRPIDAFEDNIADAEMLVASAAAFRNTRKYRMRKELRYRVGEALGIRKGDRDAMGCLESDSLFVVFYDADRLGREHFKDLRPLLRQAIVAGCAALETYIADKAMERVGELLRKDDPPKRLREIGLSVGHWLDIERQYERRQWGVRKIVEEYIRAEASAAPNKVGQILSLIGVENWTKELNGARAIAGQKTEHQLSELAQRRNVIAHAADRHGRGRAALDIQEAWRYTEQIKDIALAIEKVVNGLP